MKTLKRPPTGTTKRDWQKPSLENLAAGAPEVLGGGTVGSDGITFASPSS